MSARESELRAYVTLLATILDGVAALRSLLMEELMMRDPARIEPDFAVRPAPPGR